MAWSNSLWTIWYLSSSSLYYLLIYPIVSSLALIVEVNSFTYPYNLAILSSLTLISFIKVPVLSWAINSLSCKFYFNTLCSSFKADVYEERLLYLDSSWARRELFFSKRVSDSLSYSCRAVIIDEDLKISSSASSSFYCNSSFCLLSKLSFSEEIKLAWLTFLFITEISEFSL